MANEFKHKDPGSELTQAEFIASDGTGHVFESQAQGDVLYAISTTVLSRLAKDANATRVLTNTGTNNNPAWAQVTLTTGVTGTLPVANGGTGATTLNNLITLTTHTTGNYVATVADTGAGGILVANSGSEGAAITIQFNITGLTTDTIASGDFIAFSDEDEANDVSNKLTVDNLMETGIPLVTEDTVAVATDYMLFLDGGATGNTNKESIADFVSGIAGTNITASGGQLSASGGIASLAADTTPQVGGSAGLDLQAQLLVGNGGTTGIAISANGEVTMAAQPSCVVPADAVINITGDGTIYPVVWGTANEDRNGDFDDSTTFTCPVDGLYRFTANPGSSAYTSSHVDSRLTVVGANFAAEVQVNGFNCKNNGTTLLSIPFTALIDCDADDTVTFTFQVGGGAKVIDLNVSPDGEMSVELVV